MASDAEFANMYIERVLNEVGELNKLKLMNETRILFLEKQLLELTARFEDVTRQLEKKSSKVTKLREVDTGTF